MKSLTLMLICSAFAVAQAAEPPTPRLLATPHEVAWLAITPDSKSLIAANPQTGAPSGVENWELRCWTLATGQLVHEPIQSNALASAGAIRADGTCLVTGDYEGHWRLWKLPDLRPIADGHLEGGRIHRLAFTPDGKQFVALTADYTKKDSDPFSSSRVKYQLHTRNIEDGSAVGSAIDWPRQLPQGQMEADAHATEPVDWTLTSGPTFGRDGRPVIPTGKQIAALELPGDDPNCGGVMAEAISPDHRIAATAGCNGQVVVWDYPARRVLGKPLPVGSREFPAVELGLSQTGRFLAVACRDGSEGGGQTLSICDLSTRQLIGPPVRTGPLGVGSLEHLVFAPDQSVLAAAFLRRGGRIEKAESGIWVYKLDLPK